MADPVNDLPPGFKRVEPKGAPLPAGFRRVTEGKPEGHKSASQILEEEANLRRKGAERVLGEAGKTLEKVEPQVHELWNKVRGVDPEVDYESGAPFMAKFYVERADNPQEVKSGLEMLYGKGNAGQDPAGRWWVKIKGKKTAVYSGAYSPSTPLKKLGVGTVASAPGMIGAVTGAGVGSAIAPGPGTLIGAGVGYAAGKGLDDLAKALQGIFHETPMGEIKKLIEGGELNAILVGLPEIHGVQALKNWLRAKVFGTTPEGASMARKLLSAGIRGEKLAAEETAAGGRPSAMSKAMSHYATPPLWSVAPTSKVMQYDQMIRNLLSGNPQEAGNVAYIQGQMQKILLESGVPEEDLLKVMADINSKKTMLAGASEVGRVATKEAGAYVQSLGKSADDALAAARTAAKAQGAAYARLAETTGPIGQDVASAIGASRTQFSRAMNLAYERIEQMTAGAPVIPTAELKAAVEEQVATMHPSAVPSIYTRILKMEDSVPVMQMHALRSELRSASMAANLTPDAVNFRYGQLADVADQEFRVAEASMSSRMSLAEAGAPSGQSIMKDVIAAMRKTDAEYADGIAKYKDALINKLVRQMKTGMEPDAATVARMIGRGGNQERLNTLLGMMSPDLRKRVGAAYMQGLLQDTARRNAELGFETGGRALMDAVQQNRATLESLYGPVYGKDFVTQLESHARDLAALGGKLELNDLETVSANLGPGEVKRYLQARVYALRKIDAFVNDNFMGALASKDPAVVDRAYVMLVKPGEESRLEAAYKFFGPNSGTMQAVRKYALRDALSSAVVEMPSRATMIAGSAMDKYMAQFTKRQQEILFPNGLADDLQVLAKESRFLFPWMTSQGERDFGASLKAASIKDRVPFNLSADYQYIRAKVFGWLSDREWLIRAIAAPLKSADPAEKEVGRKMLFTAFQSAANSASSGPGGGRAGNEQP